MSCVERAIILVAGRGSRLGSLTDQCPKCLIGIGGVPILHRALSSLSSAGVREVVLVVGYLSAVVRSSVGDTYAGMRLTYVDNPRHHETSTAYSLWLARDHLQSRVLVLEGDIVFETEVLERILSNDEDGSVWAGVPVSPGRDEGILLGTDRSGFVRTVRRVRHYGYADRRLTHKCGGIQMLDDELSLALSGRLDSAICSGREREFADLILAELLKEHPMSLCSLDGLRWAEVDDPKDLRRANELLEGRIPSPTRPA